MIQHQNLQPPETNRSCLSLTLISFILTLGSSLSFFLSFFLCWSVILVDRFSFICSILTYSSAHLPLFSLATWLKFVFLQLLFGHRDHGPRSRPRISPSPGSGYHAFELPGWPLTIL